MRSLVTDFGMTFSQNKYESADEHSWYLKTLLTVYIGCINLERNEYVGWCDLVLLGEADDDVILQQGRVIRAKRGVGRDDNAGLIARGKNLCFKTRPDKPGEHKFR